MPEMTHAGQHDGEAARVRSGDDLLVAHGTARVDDGGYTGIGGNQQRVRERKERV
jgi:hypothetical protein